MTTPTPGEPCIGIDKQALYGDYRDHNKAQNAIHLQAARKALDLAEDPMSVNVTKTGISTMGALGIAGLSALGPLGMLAGYLLMNQLKPDAAPQTPLPPVVAPQTPPQSEKWESDYVIKFYDRNGKLIDVPNIKERVPE